jgi:phospholipase C
MRSKSLRAVAGLAVVSALGVVAVAAGTSRAAFGQTPTPIKHVVVFYQENHTFDNVLGVFCTTTTPHRCDGVRTGKTHTGATVPLTSAADVVPQIDHNVESQQEAINGGAMNGFDLIGGCRQRACYSTEHQPDIPNLWTLASTFAISDHTFALAPVPSWAAHEQLVTALLDGFQGDIPIGGHRRGGWGCNSGKHAQWSPTGKPPYRQVPSCVPAPAGSAAAAKEPPSVKASPVRWIPTIMDRLSGAGQTWKIYGGTRYGGWSICPTFGDCLYSHQRANMVPMTQVLSDAAAGTLPNFSVLTPQSGPSGAVSQHNGESMIVGDNWIGKVISAIEKGPNWKSTAILLTYDDCGCFYDHVPPPAGSGLGPRVPMVLISPWAKHSFTDSHAATFASILAFSEHVLGLRPLNSIDRSAYNYVDAFTFRRPAAPATMVATPEPPASKAQIAANPPNPNDAT